MVQGEQMVEAVKTAFASEPPEQLLMLDSRGPTGETVLTLTTSAASKGNCLRIACSALNQSPDAVIAFGDSEGDLDLFETAGLSVAMGQALPSVRNAADFVTDANILDFVFSRTNDSLNALINDTLLPADVTNIFIV